MTDRAAITAELEEVKPVKTRKCLQIICEVPMESADAALEALGGFPIPGQSRPVAIALLKPDRAVEQTEEQPTTENWSLAKRSMVQRSGILRKEKAFQDYVRNGWRVLWNHERHREHGPEEKAAYFIRTGCGVESCRDLDPAGESGRRFREMVNRYESSQHGDTEEARLAQRDRT